MADLLSTGMAWLAGMVKNHASQSVVYARGANTVTLYASPRNVVFRIEDAGILTEWQGRDFVIQAADLILGGVVTIPQAGDQITETVGDTTHTWEVAEFSGEVFRYTDPYRTMFRVHAKEVA